MDKSIFTGKNVIVQGITGKNGQFHTRNMVAYGTNIIAGVTPGKGGAVVDSIPVYNSVAEIQKDTPIDASVIFVPAPFAKGAIFEAIDANIPLIVCVTEHIPVYVGGSKTAKASLLGQIARVYLPQVTNCLALFPPRSVCTATLLS